MSAPARPTTQGGSGEQGAGRPAGSQPPPQTHVSTEAIPWVPLAPGKWFRPIRFFDRGWSQLLRLAPGAGVPLHRHTGPVEALVLTGRRRLDTGEVQGPGDHTYEPTGTVDAWYAVGEEDCVVHLRLEGACEFIDESGEVVSVLDAGTQAAAYLEWCRAEGLAPLVPEAAEAAT